MEVKQRAYLCSFAISSDGPPPSDIWSLSRHPQQMFQVSTHKFHGSSVSRGTMQDLDAVGVNQSSGASKSGGFLIVAIPDYDTELVVFWT